MATVLSSAARTAAGTQTFQIPEKTRSLMLQLDVTAAATDAGDILALWLQGTVDGTNYYDIGRFADVLGNGGAKRYIMVVNREAAAESELITPTDGSLAAGSVTQGPFPASDLRLKWTVTDVSTDNASFTFSVTSSVIY